MLNINRKRTIMAKYRQIALDFDGCIYNQNVLKCRGNVFEGNKAFLQHLNEENKSFDGVFLSTASNRQSVHLEKNAGKMNCTYSFPVLLQLLEFLKQNNPTKLIQLDALLLADIRGNLDAGEAFKLATTDADTADQPHCLFDETKATILYAQIHKVATEHPNDEITYDFFDDRQDILDSLSTLFSQYPALLPKNVTVRMYRYAGGPVSLHAQIQGTSDIDVNYRETVKQMCHIYLDYSNKTDDQYSILRTHETTTPDLLTERTTISYESEPYYSEEERDIASYKEASNQFSLFGGVTHNKNDKDSDFSNQGHEKREEYTPDFRINFQKN